MALYNKPIQDEILKSYTKEQIRKIAEYKMPDLNCNDIEAAMNIIAGSARNMGITIDD